MFGIFLISSYVLMACAGPPVNGYTLGSLSGGRGQEYTSGYRTSTYGLKDNQADYSENGGSQRYSVGSGSPSYASTTGSYQQVQVADSGYSDGNQASGYGSQSVGSQSSGVLSSSSYASEPAGLQSGSSELVGASYSASGSTSPSLSYTGSSSSPGNHGQSYEYSEVPVSDQSSLTGSLSGAERDQYSSRPSSPYVSYSVGGPKSSSYSSASHPGHPGTRYSSSPSVSFSPSSHHPMSSGSSSFPGESSHRVVSPGHGYSGQSLKSFLAGIHGNGPNYIHGTSPHRASPGHHIFASASNPAPGYSSRGPASSYFSGNSIYPRGGNPGGKIIIVKDNSHHPGSVYPAEHHGYNGAMFAASSPSYKIRNVGSHSSHGPPGFSNSYSASSPYTAMASSHSSNPSSFFSFL